MRASACFKGQPAEEWPVFARVEVQVFPAMILSFCTSNSCLEINCLLTNSVRLGFEECCGPDLIREFFLAGSEKLKNLGKRERTRTSLNTFTLCSVIMFTPIH